MSLRARKHNKISLEQCTEALDIASSMASPSSSNGLAIIEKEIEGAWHESAKLGWSFNGFAAAMLEVLTVLHERNRMKAEKAKQHAGGL
jgi:hypothetical protein